MAQPSTHLSLNSLFALLFSFLLKSFERIPASLDKKKFIMLMALISMTVGGVWGQTTLFQFTFENVLTPVVNNTLGTPSFIAYGVSNNTCNTTNPGCGTGSAYMYRANGWTAGDYYQFTVNTTGFTNLSFSYCDRTNGNNFNTNIVRVSPDGFTWTTVFAAYTPANAAPLTRNTSTFPASCENVSTVYIQIYKSATTTDRYYYIDNAILIGTCTPPAQPSVITGATCLGSNTSQTYSVVDVPGVTYNWTFPAGWTQTAGGTTSSVTVTAPVGSSGNVTVTPQSACGSNGTASTLAVTVNGVSPDDPNVAGTDSWVGHVYSGTTFGTYRGSYTEAETFNEGFGGDATCFSITSNSSSSSIYTDLFSVKYRMNSTKKGLYIADMGSDDGVRLTVDGTMVYNAWVDRGYTPNNGVLFNLNGASNLLFEFYENAGGNQVSFNNLTLVLANSLSTNTSQSIEQGLSGTAISGDVYGALPTGITLSGTGYQWSYSTTPGGARINITGATGATYTPNTSIAPFNTLGTYYIYRNAILSSANNVSPATYVATNESNAATLTVTAPTYYSQGSGDPSVLANWKSAGGNTPVNFSSDNQVFIIQTGHVMTTTGAGWVVTGTSSAIQVNSGGTLSCAANSPVTGTASLTLASGSTLEIGSADGISSTTSTGSIQVTGTRTFSTGANYTYNNTASQVTGNQLPATVNNLTFSGSGTKTLQSNVSVVGDLTVVGSTLDLGLFTANRSASGGTLSLDATSTLLIGGTNTFPANYTANTLAVGSIVNYLGSNQSVASQTYSNLILSGSGIKTAAGAISATGTLDNGGTTNDAITLTMAGNTLTAGAIENTNATIRFSGANNGVAVSTGTVEYNGAIDQSVAAGVYSNLTLSNSNKRNLLASTTINGVLTVGGSTSLQTSTHDLNLGGSGVSIAAGADITTANASGNVNFTTSQSITGAGTFTLDNTLNIGAGVTVTNASTGFILAGSLTGADASSKFVNTGTITDKNTGATLPAIMTTGTLDLSSNPNLVIYDGSGIQDILPFTHYNVQLNSTCDLKASTEILGNLTKSGTVSLGIAHPYTLIVRGDVSFTGTSSIKLTDAAARAEFYGATNVFLVPASTVAGSTIAFLRAGDQSLPASLRYENLQLGGSGIKTLAGASTISGNYSSTVSLATANDLTFAGTTTCGGDINATAGTVTYSTTAVNIIKGNYTNLTINGPGVLCDYITVSNPIVFGGGGSLDCNGFVPAVPTVGSTVNYCVGAVSVPLTATALAGHTLVWYTVASGGVGAASITPSTASAGTTSYWVSQKNNNTGCESNRVQLDVTVNAYPAIPTITASGATTFCSGGSVILTSSALSNNVWSITSEITQAITVNTTGSYTVTTTSNGCASTSLPTVVTVNPLPAVPTASSNSPVCQGSTLNLNAANVTGSTGYAWTGPLAYTSTLQTPASITNALPTQSGNYTVTVTDGNSCKNTSTVSVIVNATPSLTSADISGKIVNVCKNTDEIYSVTKTFSSYLWSVVGGTITTANNTQSITIHWADDFVSPKSITLVGTDANGCSNTVTLSVTVTQAPTETLSFTGTVQSYVCPGANNVVYQINTPVSPTWAWSVTTGATLTVDNSVHTASVNFDASTSGVVTLSVSAINSCGDKGPVISQAIAVGATSVYAQANGDIATANLWNTAANGSGAPYTYDATSSLRTKYYTNGKAITIATASNVGGIHVDGGSLTVNNPVTFNSCGNSEFEISVGATVTLNSYIDASAGTGNVFTMDGSASQLIVPILNSATHANDYLYGFSSRTFNAGTVTYNASSEQVLASYSYPNLVLAGSSIKDLAKAITVNGDLTINGGATLKATTEEGSVDLFGNWVDNGTFNTNGYDAEVVLSNTIATQNIKESGSFKGLVIDKAAGTYVTLTNSLTIGGYLNFAGPGILQLNSSNLILNAGAYIDANGDKSKFSVNRMIEVTGSTTNSLVTKSFDPADDLKSGGYYEFFAPIGNAGKYTPMNLRPLLIQSTFVSGRSITVTTLPFVLAGESNWVKRQWVVTSTFNESTEVSNAYLSFNYDGATELSGKPTLVRNGGTTITNGFSIYGSSNIFSFGSTSGNAKIQGTWTCYGTSAGASKYYSVNGGGTWENPNSWSTNYTTPAAGSKPAAGGPNSGDEVVIKAGSPIVKDPSKIINVASIEIESGAILDLQQMTSAGSLITPYLSGQGTLRLSSSILPSVTDMTQFVASTGGTIEYYGTTAYAIDASKAIYNNLTFSGSSIKTINRCTASGNAYTLNGILEVKGGTVRLDQTATANGGTTGLVALNIYGDFNVRSGATFTVGTSTNYSTHEISLYGNFLNDGGTVSLTSNTSTAYTTASIYERSVTTETKSNFNILNISKDQLIDCNGSTRFYRINIDKGSVSQKATIRANNTDNFHLMGINNQTDNDGGNWNGTWAQELKALSMQHGTCVIGDNIKIYDLIYNCARNYRVNDDVNFTIDGNNAFVDVCIYDADGGNSTLMLYGKLTVNNGEIHSYYSKGVEIWGFGQVLVNGGILRTSNICAPSSGTLVNRGAFEMNGGEVWLDGVMAPTGSTGNRGTQRLGLVNSTQSFIMTGGTMNVYDQYLRSSPDLINIGVDPNNAKVTGGNVNVYFNNNDASYTLADIRGISSTAPFWNMAVYQMQGASSYVCKLFTNLTVLNNFDLKLYGTQPVTVDCNSKNITIGGNLTVEGASAFSNTATFTFNGTTNATQNINLGTNTLAVTNMIVNNTATNGQVVVKNNNITVSSDLSILKGTLDDAGKTITVSGNIVNSATHKSSIIGGGIIIGGAGTQCLISGDGTGVFGNLTLNRTTGALTSAMQTISGILTLTNGVFGIATNNLSFTNVSATPVLGYSTVRYISTSGNKSDGGVTYQTGGTVSNLIFPVAASAIYLPFTVNAINSTVAGSITIKPSSTIHKLANATSLTRFWSVNQTGYDNMSNYQLTFDNQTAITVGYLAARIREGETAWTSGAAVSGNTFGWTESSNNFAGDYTCGSGLGGIYVFTSNGTGGGDWNSSSTWTKTLNGVVNATAPLMPVGISNCRVIIQKTDSVYVLNTATYTISVGALQIADGARLDLGTTLSSKIHDFGSAEKIGGRGKLLISYNGGTIRFPSGDFGNFLGASGGTVEYYANGAIFSIPTTNASYYNLILNKREATARAITVSQSSLTVYNNLSVLNTYGSNTLTAAFTAAPLTATIAGSVNVGAAAAMTIIPNGGATFTVAKNITNSGTLSCTNTNASGLMTVKGNITNAGTFTLYNTGNYKLKFAGANSSLFSGSGTATLYQLIVDKTLSNSRDTMVEVKAPISLGATAYGALATKPLVLTYGTYKHNTSSSITINGGSTTASTSDFIINANAKLWVANGIVTVDANPTASNGVNLYGGIALAGKLYITDNGVLNVLNTSNSYENYIQYTGGSSPEMEVTGGTVNVASQIRRFSDNISGTLVYKQSGGTVNIGTKAIWNLLGNRGMFEIVNNGQFIMSGGNLNLMTSMGNTMPDFLIETNIPSATAGGTITLGTAGGYTAVLNSITTTVAARPLRVKCNVSLGNVLVANNLANTSTTANDVQIESYPLTITGNLIVQDDARLGMLTDNLTMSVGGDLNFNSTGSYDGKLNQTLLNGSAQQILTGNNLIFNELKISNTSATSSVLVVDKVADTYPAFTVNSYLTLDKGVFNLQAAVGSLKSDLVFNNGTSTNNTDGYLSFDNTTYMQYVSGNAGEVGDIRINNDKNVRLAANLTVHKGISFVKGYLDVDQYNLSVESTTSLSGTFSQTSKIRTPGTTTGGQLIMQFNGGAALSGKLIPIGAQERYTPVTITTAQSDNNARLEIKPVYAPHPYIVDVSASEALQYYWVMKASTGYLFPSTSSISFVFNWDDTPTAMALNVGLHNYQPACLHTSRWCLFPSSGINDTLKTITFSGLRADTLDGDYTAGAKPAFTIIPTVFTSIKTGVLTDKATWDKNDIPGKGDIIRIVNSDVVSFDKTNLNLSASYLDVNATLNIETTSILNNLGTVTGTGTLVLKNNGMQDGTYTDFFSITGGTLEYRNLLASSMIVSDKVPTYNNLSFRNTAGGSILLPSIGFEVLGRFSVLSGIVNGSASAKTIKLDSAFVNNGIFNANNHTIEVKGLTVGSNNQYFTGSGNMYLTNLLLNKTNGGDLYLNTTNPIQINGTLSFNSGKLKTTDDGSVTFNTGANYTLNSNHLSYAVTKVTKVANNESFIFPVGNNILYRPVESNTSFTGSASVQYFNNTPSYDITSDIDLQVDEFEYWKVSPSATNNFTFKWTDANQSPLSGTDMATLRLATWNTVTSKWDVVPSTTTSGNSNSGAITVTNLPTGESRYALAALQKLDAYCPGSAGDYVAPIVSGTGNKYRWTLTPASAGKLTVDATDNTKAHVAFDGTNLNLYDQARLQLLVTNSIGSDTLRVKSYRLITYPRTPALNLPAFICANTDVILTISDEFSKWAWYTDDDSNPASGLNNVQSGSDKTKDYMYKVNRSSPIYVNVQGFYTYVDAKNVSYTECPSLLLNPNKLITPIAVTPGGIYRYPNK